MSAIEREYFKETSSANYQYDLDKNQVLAFYLSRISHYFKYFGIGGIHFTKVHRMHK